MAVEPFGGPAQIELDHLGRTGTDEEEELDLRPAIQKLIDDLVQLVVGVGQAGQVPVVDDGGAETRFGENHHTRRRLHQMGAGARPDDQEEGVLDPTVQPDDAGEAAEDLPLAALADDRHLGAAFLGRLGGWERGGHGHYAASMRLSRRS